VRIEAKRFHELLIFQISRTRFQQAWVQGTHRVIQNCPNELQTRNTASVQVI